MGFRRIGKISKEGRVDLLNDHFDLSSYDFVVVGSPIWAGKPAVPCISYLERIEGKDDLNIALRVGGARSLKSNLKSTEGWIEQLSEMGFSSPVAALTVRSKRRRIVMVPNTSMTMSMN